MAAYLHNMQQTPETAVLYNAECPVCNFEISHYATYASREGLSIKFDDLNTPACDTWGMSPDQAARRLYVRKNGQLISGIPAFLVLWREMPRYRWLARLVGLPGIRQLSVLMYDYVLAPAIYQWHLLRQRRRVQRASR